MGVEIRISFVDEQGSVIEEKLPLKHSKEEVDKTVQFGIHESGDFNQFYMEPIEGSPSAFRAYRTEDPNNTDFPGTVKKKEAPRTYIDMLTPANPVVLYSGENGVVFSAHVSPDVASLTNIPQELHSEGLPTAAD